MQNKFYKNYSFWFGMIGFAGFVFSVYGSLNIPQKKLEYRIEKIVNLLEINDNEFSIKVYIKDSLDIVKLNKNISIYEIDIVNDGAADIKSGDYDQSLNFGIKVLKGEILNKANFTKSSDKYYFQDVLLKNTTDKIFFEKKIIDSKNFFSIKFYVIHDKNVMPELLSIGKISAQKNIPIVDVTNDDINKNDNYKESLKYVYTSLIFTTLGFIGLMYAYFRSLRVSKIISQQELTIKELMSKGKSEI